MMPRKGRRTINVGDILYHYMIKYHEACSHCQEGYKTLTIQNTISEKIHTVKWDKKTKYFPITPQFVKETILANEMLL